MPEYQIVRVITRKNKENKDYNLALVLFNRSDDSDLIRIYVTSEQAQKLISLVDKHNTDISNYVHIEYNSYQKVYQPKIKI